jgi:hypothetical protein
MVIVPFSDVGALDAGMSKAQVILGAVYDAVFETVIGYEFFKGVYDIGCDFK